MSQSNGNYTIGYGKPPIATQFKKGVSGNPNGRPKGKPNLATALQRAMYRRVVVNEGGQRKTITKFEAAITQLVNKSAAGDLNAFKFLAGLYRTIEEQAPEGPLSNKELMNEADKKLLQNMFKRFSGEGASDK
jgi:hypothetical protein